MLIAKQQKNMGYTIKKGTLGTVKVNVRHTTMFRNQLIVSNINLTG